MKIAEKVKEFFHNEGIHSTTIQPEFVELPLGGSEVRFYKKKKISSISKSKYENFIAKAQFHF